MVIVEDNGVGMTSEELNRLTNDIKTPPTEQTGYALWNVRERLMLQFGHEATITFQAGENKGIIVTLAWPRHSEPTEN